MDDSSPAMAAPDPDHDDDIAALGAVDTSLWPSVQQMAFIWSNDTSASEFLQGYSVLSFDQSCPSCGAKGKRMSKTANNANFWKFCCQRNAHHADGKTCKWSAKTGTILGGGSLTCSQLLIMVYEWLLGSKQVHIAMKAGVNKNTVTVYCRLFRAVVTSAMRHVEKNRKLGGEGTLVEIDESKFGKRKYNRGHSVPGCWVFGGVERCFREDGTAYAGRFFARVVPDRTNDTLLPLIKELIAPGTTILSDGWAGYGQIPNMEGCGYRHATVNHSKTYKSRDGTHTNTIEGCWNAKMKLHIPSRCYTMELLQERLYFQMWRSEHRANLWNAFWVVLGKMQFEPNGAVRFKIGSEQD
jgi:ISXO2-like transposase domain